MNSIHSDTPAVSRVWVCRILEILLAVALIIFWIPSFRTDGITSSASFESVSEAVLSRLDETVYPAQDNQKIKRYLALDPSAFEEISFYRTDDAMAASELVIAKSSNPQSLSAFEEAVQQRAASQQAVYEGYAPEQAALAEQALIDVQGNYALYYVGEKPAAVDNVFLNALKQG